MMKTSSQTGIRSRPAGNRLRKAVRRRPKITISALRMPVSGKQAFILSCCCIYSIVCAAQHPDIDLLKQLNLNRDRSLDGLFRVITDYAAPVAYSVPLVLLLIGLVLKNSILKAKSVFIIQGLMIAVVTATLIKYLVNRPRPFITYPWLEKVTTGGSPSFPSGHTTDAFALAASLSFVFPRWYVMGPVFAWAAAVGYSRMDLGVHYPSDVIASVIIGVLCPYFLYRAKRRKEQGRIAS